MFTGEAKSDFPKLPTLLQYCKTAADFPPTKAFLIQKIWFPNQFPSLSLCTEVFLLRISTTESFYHSLEESLYKWEQDESCPVIRISDKTKAKWEIDLLEGERCIWEELGPYGKSLTVQEKKRSRNRSH